MIKEHIPNKEIDEARKKMIEEYDQLFARIMTLKPEDKGSPEHKALLKQEIALTVKSRKFIEKHYHYFSLKRSHLVRKGVMNRPQILPMDNEEKRTFAEEEKFDHNIIALEEYNVSEKDILTKIPYRERPDGCRRRYNRFRTSK